MVATPDPPSSIPESKVVEGIFYREGKFSPRSGGNGIDRNIFKCRIVDPIFPLISIQKILKSKITSRKKMSNIKFMLVIKILKHFSALVLRLL